MSWYIFFAVQVHFLLLPLNLDNLCDNLKGENVEEVMLYGAQHLFRKDHVCFSADIGMETISDH